MATTARGASGPGVTVGPTSEFSLFFRVKPGAGESLRAALRDLQDTPGYRPGEYGIAISTIPRRSTWRMRTIDGTERATLAGTPRGGAVW